MRTLLLAGAAALLLSACATQSTASAAAPEGRDCFRTDDVDNYSVVDRHTVRVFPRSNRAYDLHVPMNARELDFGMRIGLRSGSSWICTGNGFDTEILAVGDTINRRWSVATITRVPDEQLRPGTQQQPAPTGS